MSPLFHPNFPFETLLQWMWFSFFNLVPASSQKTISIYTDDLNNFRPISNHNFISKILEKVVASHIQSHLSSNSLSSSFQSAYRIFHSTYSSQNSQWPHPCDGSRWGHFTHSSWLICCFWYCKSFHPFARLQNWFGLTGLSLNLFTSYLSSRSQAVSINDSISVFSTLSCTSWFRTWPTAFYSLYTTPLVRWWHPAVHLFHSYKFCSISWNTTTFTDILSWMNLNKLLLNSSKTEFLLIGTKQQRLKFSDLTNLSLSNVSSSARNLGIRNLWTTANSLPSSTILATILNGPETSRTPYPKAPETVRNLMHKLAHTTLPSQAACTYPGLNHSLHPLQLTHTGPHTLPSPHHRASAPCAPQVAHPL